MSSSARVVVLLTTAALLPSLGACLDHPLKPVSLTRQQEEQQTVPISVNRDVDVLFVIDNSGSMAGEQATLAENFASFIGVLERPGVDANYRIGITTTDDGHFHCNTPAHSGRLRLSSCLSRPEEFVFGTSEDAFEEACASHCDLSDIEILPTTTHRDHQAKPRPWLERIDGVTNLPPEISTVEAFQCFGPQGIAGCGFESHLEAMNKTFARAEREDDDAYGFFRPGAILAVVFVTDEEDCSARDGAELLPAWTSDGTLAFWTPENIETGNPTSEICWFAGTTCETNGDGSLDCHATDEDINGDPADGEDAVLFPVSRYTELLARIEEEKKKSDPNQEVLVAVIGGVPPGYAEDSSIDLEYRNSTLTDPEFQRGHGIGPGCDVSGRTAAPPVRLREFAEEFEAGDARNLHSVCEADYSGALEAIADAIAVQVRPPCVQTCVELSPDPNCTVTETMIDADGLPEERGVPACERDGDGWVLPSGAASCFYPRTDADGSTASEADDMSSVCAAEGWNLELGFLRADGERVSSGTTVSATCAVSPYPSLDCPHLP